MRIAMVTKNGGQAETGETVLILDKTEGQLLQDMAEEYAQNHKRSGKAKKFVRELEGMACF